MAKQWGKNLIKYIPQLAAVYAFYEYYADRGLDGIRADLEAMTIEGIKAKFQLIITGLLSFVIGDLIASKVKDRYLKVAIKSIAYYVGAKQLASALRQGAGVSAMRRGGAGYGYSTNMSEMRGY